MSPRGLLCLLLAVGLSLPAVAGAARGADGVGSDGVEDKLVDVRVGGEHAALPPSLDASPEQTWTFDWSEIDATDGRNRPPMSGGATARLAPAHHAPPIIAAPLPPALLSGLIGLAGVYAYKRKHRLR